MDWNELFTGLFWVAFRAPLTASLSSYQAQFKSKTSYRRENYLIAGERTTPVSNTNMYHKIVKCFGFFYWTTSAGFIFQTQQELQMSSGHRPGCLAAMINLAAFG